MGYESLSFFFLLPVGSRERNIQAQMSSQWKINTLAEHKQLQPLGSCIPFFNLDG
jgi:hypothetical protein